ncbi:hypothetical protein R1flu_021519 [Riccia fluitans]|uniref:Uncharacterized protein n=1 Tax=Riccia fluitans TaxID=41844 RepID=A0ABD1ZRK4_9MARC
MHGHHVHACVLPSTVPATEARSSPLTVSRSDLPLPDYTREVLTIRVRSGRGSKIWSIFRSNTMQAKMMGVLVWVLLWAFLGIGKAENNVLDLGGTITFGSVGRAHYAYDVFAVSLPNGWSPPQFLSAENLKETRLTDGVSLNYNGHFVEGANKLALDVYLSRTRPDLNAEYDTAGESESLIYVSERSGYPRMHMNRTHFLTPTHGSKISNAGAVELSVHDPEFPFMNDRPAVGGGNLVFVSTVKASGRPGIGWASVYSTNLRNGKTVRLSPVGVAEYSPAISPSGKWIVAAANSKRAVDEGVLETDLYVYRANDGSRRRLLAKNGGWPTWLDEKTIFFHRRADDGWWSIYRLDLPAKYFITEGAENELPEPERITPPGVHALTPAASRTGNWLAVATRRPQFLKHVRHVELFDLKSSEFIKVTELLSPNVSHFSPFLSRSGKIGYHRCRGAIQGPQTVSTLEALPSSLPNLSLFRMDGTYPTFSPDGTALAFNRDSADSALVVPAKSKGIYLINLAGKITQTHIYTGRAFGLVWDPKRTGVIYISAGKLFEPVDEEINIVSISNVFGPSKNMVTKQLTKSGTGNNGMPFPSPDGTKMVFRSGRSGYKNLYIMDAIDGEEKMLVRLTNGNWTDNHPRWSASGEWIIFISDREDPGSWNFNIYMIHPDGTGLRKILGTGPGMKTHPCFLGDEKFIVFSSNYAGFTAEPISVALQFMPQGELFIANVDDPSSLRRLTHNSYEDGSAVWSPTQLSQSDLERLSASGLAQTLKCNNPDYYDDVFPSLEYSGTALDSRVTPSSGCGHARSNMKRKHHEL